MDHESRGMPLSSSQKFLHPESIKNECLTVLRSELEALSFCIDNFPTKDLAVLVELILSCTGHIVFSGIGKSGLIARKCSATFSSCGIPSFFLHPTEALHGDLGMVMPQDCVIAFSKSGNGGELRRIFSVFKKRNIKHVLVSCMKGLLSSQVDLNLILPFKKEACSFDAAPTSSSTIMLAFGDALALTVRSFKGFDVSTFALLHPGGSLGASLTLDVASLMHEGSALPLIAPTTSFKELIFIMTSKKLGVALVVNMQHELQGIITDGDLRRACEGGAAIFEKNAEELMTKNALTISPDLKARDALLFMEQKKITSLVVVEQHKVVGLIHIHDILKAEISR